MSDAAAHVRRGLAQLEQLPPGQPVPSPCNNVCRIDPATGWCEGCLRTLDEIAAWGGLDQGAKWRVWQVLGARAGEEQP